MYVPVSVLACKRVAESIYWLFYHIFRCVYVGYFSAYPPIRGSVLASGMFSAMASCSRYRDRNTVSPIPTLSPLSHGNRKLNNVRIQRMSVGAITVYK